MSSIGLGYGWERSRKPELLARGGQPGAARFAIDYRCVVSQRGATDAQLFFLWYRKKDFGWLALAVGRMGNRGLGLDLRLASA